ncbi:hypothetical protein [Streptomyces sp. NPDC093094]|uniref:hypothetical protein n=1 Tax=Streptomyces sp. NPDC093094 TaxID=3366026 RepID=UPI003806849C
MDDRTPSRAEGEAEEDVRDVEDLPLPGDPLPSQAEGERYEEDEEEGDDWEGDDWEGDG